MKETNKYLKGDKIYLREVRESDVNDEYYNWLNDYEVNKYLETRYIPRSKDNILKFVKQMDGNANEILFAICDISSHIHIGNIKLGPINWIHRFGDISLLIGNKEYWGKGVATEAIKLVTEFGFQVLNLHKVKAGCYESNIGSAEAFKKVGFEIEGRLKKMWKVDSKYYDEILLGLCVEDYKKIDLS